MTASASVEAMLPKRCESVHSTCGLYPLQIPPQDMNNIYLRISWNRLAGVQWSLLTETCAGRLRYYAR